MKRVAIVLSLAILLPVGAVTAACGARAQAKTVPDGPPLDIPAPPPREVEPAPVEAPAPPAATPEPPRPAAPRPQPARPAPPREQPPRENRAEPPRTEAPKIEAIEPPKPAEEPKPGTLTTKPTGEENDLERGIRATLTHANTDLSRVDYRKLNSDARTQYDSAKRFINQAEDAIRAKNLVFAKTVADKAAALAAQLAGM